MGRGGVANGKGTRVSVKGGQPACDGVRREEKGNILGGV